MSYDGIVMRAVALELTQMLQGARIDKIYQPTRQEILMVLRQRGQNHRLLLSALPQEAAVYLTEQPRTNPPEPPLFCMVMRKHLEGGRVVSVEQRGLERILEITCEVLDELGDLVRRRVIVEVMGKHSNIILLNPENNKIIDAILRVTPLISRWRQVLPGLPYQSPPPQDKLLLWEADMDGFYEKILSQPLTSRLDKAVLSSFGGLGPQSVTEILARAQLDPQLAIEYCGEYELSRLWQEFRRLAADAREGHFFPEVVVQDGQPQAFSAFALTQFGPPARRQAFTSISKALDFYYRHRKNNNVLQQKRADLFQLVKKELERCEKKAGLQLQTVQEAENSEHYRLWGELLTANNHTLQPGPSVEVTNYYREGQVETIPLDEHRSIMENAQHYFNKYQKARHSARQAQEQLQETRLELNYLNSLADSLETVTVLQDLEEIREELQEAGYLKTAPTKRSGSKAPEKSTARPVKKTIDGWDILYGKNNKQNDYLTMKIARSTDTWLHVKDIPGSHVVVKNPAARPLPKEILEQAALLAAYHSRARLSTHVPVDYTLRKHVWKPKGAKPGMVLYDNQQTVYVTPEEKRIKTLLETTDKRDE